VAAKTTPLIAQYLSVKRQVPDALLFFRLGDFYEMFFEDAETGARLLGLQLTSRSKDGVPLCGVPYHAAEPYIARLLRAGRKVAICEQAAGEAGARGLIPRRIVRLITPGTVGEEVVLTAAEKSYLVALAALGENYALSAIDVSTGEFLITASTSPATLHEELARLAPREVLIAPSVPWRSTVLAGLNATATELEPRQFDPDAGRAALARRFGMEAPELDASTAAAAGAILGYIERTFGDEFAHLRPPVLYHPTQYLTVDEVTRRHLELVATAEGSREGSLVSVLDQTLTPMGARTLRNWLVYPLLDLEAIAMRHDAVAELFESDLDGPPAQALRGIGDLERAVGRIGSLRASPREVVRTAGALEAVANLARALAGAKSALIRSLAAQLKPRPDLANLIRAAVLISSE
jgi:DNA mismatch repair protein MutS